MGKPLSASNDTPTRGGKPSTRQGDHVIVIVRNCCVSLQVVEVVVARPSVKSGDMSSVVQGSVDDACEEPLCPCRRIRENCASHGCPSAWNSDLNFVFQFVMQEFRRPVLPVATGGDVSGVLKRSSDGWMRPPVRGPNQRALVNILLPQFSEFHLSCVSFRSNASCEASPRAAAMEEATHTSRAALRPGTAAVVRLSAGLDCEAVTPLCSVVIPVSGSLSPPKTA